MKSDYFDFLLPHAIEKHDSGGKQFLKRIGWQSSSTSDKGPFRAVLSEHYARQEVTYLAATKVGSKDGVSADAIKLFNSGQFKDVVDSLEVEDVLATKAAAKEIPPTRDPSACLNHYEFLSPVIGQGEMLDFVGGLLGDSLTFWPQASIWWVTEDQIVPWRSSVLRMMFAQQNSPESLDATEESFEGFMSGRGLQDPSFSDWRVLIKLFLLLGAPTPYGHCFNRPNGCLVLLFGEPFELPRSTTMKERLRPMNFLLRESLELELTVPKPTAQEIESAFEWWMGQASRLIGVRQDPANYKDGDRYCVRTHFCTHLSLSRFLVSVQANFANTGEDEFGRFCQLFDSQDITEGLLKWNPASQQNEIKWIKKEMQHICSQVPVEIRTVILGKAKLGQYALEKVSSGFFRQPSAGVGGKNVPGFLRMLRNSTHSFGKVDANHLELLASHNGLLSPQISDLAAVYLLHIMTVPENLFRGRERYLGAIQNRRGPHAPDWTPDFHECGRGPRRSLVPGGKLY